MLGSILTNARTWALCGLLALGATAIDAAASCGDASNGYVCQLDASNFYDGADTYGCPGQAVTEIDIVVVRISPYAVDGTGVFYRCATSSDLIWFFGAGALHLVESANGGTWGAVGGGLCSYFNYTAYPF